MKLSIIIPVYNEAETIKDIINKVTGADIEKEIIIVDDGSCDGTREILKNFEDKFKIRYHPKNMGKGAALRTGLKYITGDVVIIQDADLEYNPQDYRKLIEPICKGETEVVYGSRFFRKETSIPSPRRFFYFTHFLGNKFLNFCLNLLYHTKITDMETCYKAMKKDVISHLDLNANGFEIEPEITVNLLKRRIKILEIPISYAPRDYKHGKKITWRDGIKALQMMLKYRFRKKD